MSLRDLTGLAERVPPDAKPQIELGADIDRVATMARAALSADPTLYQNAGRFVGVVREPEPGGKLGRLRMVPVRQQNMRERLSAVATFAKWVKEGRGKDAPLVLVNVPPPADVADMLLQGETPATVRPLVGVVDAPVLRPDGTVLQEPGYDTATGFYYEPRLEYPPVASSPTRDDAIAALAALDAVFVDFPFADGASRSALLAAILTPPAWSLVDGKAPMFVFEANIRGTGKTLAAQLCGTIATGIEPAAVAGPPHDEECQKRIIAHLRAGDRIALLDNLVGKIGWPSLDSTVTTGRIGGRILGISENVNAPACTCWYLSVNNGQPAADAFRRIQLIRFVSETDAPEKRDGFKHPDVRAHVNANRAELAVAALTVLRAYCAAGRPDQKLPAWGSFEAWTSIVRSALVWCGRTDPYEARRDLERRGDPEAVAWRALLEHLADAWPHPETFTAADILARPALHEALVDCVTPPKDKPLPSAKSIGKAFAKRRETRFGDMYLYDETPSGKAAAKWQVRRNQPPVKEPL
jgi:hypothetical protein